MNAQALTPQAQPTQKHPLKTLALTAIAGTVATVGLMSATIKPSVAAQWVPGHYNYYGNWIPAHVIPGPMVAYPAPEVVYPVPGGIYPAPSAFFVRGHYNAYGYWVPGHYHYVQG